MPTLIAHHDVKDQKHWLASPKREEVFGPLGVTNIRTFIDPENPSTASAFVTTSTISREERIRSSKDSDGASTGSGRQ